MLSTDQLPCSLVYLVHFDVCGTDQNDNNLQDNVPQHSKTARNTCILINQTKCRCGGSNTDRKASLAREHKPKEIIIIGLNEGH